MVVAERSPSSIGALFLCCNAGLAGLTDPQPQGSAATLANVPELELAQGQVVYDEFSGSAGSFNGQLARNRLTPRVDCPVPPVSICTSILPAL